MGIERMPNKPSGERRGEWETCPTCRGTGMKNTDRCPTCNGVGKLKPAGAR